MTESNDEPRTTCVIGVLALQGAFEEHQACLEAVGCRTVQVRCVRELEGIDGIVLPGGESTAMGLIGNASVTPDGLNVWDGLREFMKTRPVWGTCAGMILLAEQCVGASAVIENGQALIGGMDIFVCRNYFGSQVSSFEMPTPPPPRRLGLEEGVPQQQQDDDEESYPGVYIRAPAILSVGPDVHILGKVMATPCRQAAVVLEELERRIAKGEKVVQMGVVDALERKSDQDITYRSVIRQVAIVEEEEKKEFSTIEDSRGHNIVLPGAADGSNAREVISAVRKGYLLCTAFHPELTTDYRWHEYFAKMVRECKGTS